jgi:transposase
MSRMGSSNAGRRARRQFTEEFRTGAVRLVLDEGKTVGAVARELDLTPSSLSKWVSQARADRSHGKTGLTTAEREELARLRKENRILQEERDILKNVARANVARLVDQKLHEVRSDARGCGRPLSGDIRTR